MIVASLIALAAAQYRGEPKNAAILQEARYLSGDGSFGSAYSTDDGSEFKEETDASGNRKGQYSYVDPNGKKITVQYTAGTPSWQQDSFLILRPKKYDILCFIPILL